MATKKLSAQARDALIETLQERFAANPDRHPGIEWADVLARLDGQPGKLWTLAEMERTGGQPDVVALDEDADGYFFVDCSVQSPNGRRSLCFDAEALESRKKHKPEDSAMNLASALGVELLTEAQYRRLQELGEFDTKTSSWVQTPARIRELGGALFCDRRYDTVFVYHNGAESYYAARGFRAALRV